MSRKMQSSKKRSPRWWVSASGTPSSSRMKICVNALTVVLVFLANVASGQNSITGKITDASGIALPGATVQILKTNTYTVSDAEGRFTLAAKPGDILEVSFIGYVPFQFVLRDEKSIDIPLSESPLLLDEVVVVGYGTTQRKSVTGAVANISSEDFVSGNVTNGLQQIQGKIPGVVIVQPGGDPNGDFNVRIRGATSIEGQPPLLVIDGVAIDDFNRAITTLNPADISSVDVLKDASAAAIYGSRGANGVMLITTKGAQSGKTTFEYNGFGSVEKVSNQFDVLSGDQWRTAVKNDTTAYHYDKGANTDWQKEITRTAFTQSHMMSVSGGSEQLRVRGSVGYLNQEGVVMNTGKEMLTARINADVRSENKKFTMNYRLNASVINRDFLPDQNSTAQVRQGGAYVFGLTAGYLPVWPVYNDDGSFYHPASSVLNPVFLLSELYSKQQQNFFQGSGKADYEILSGLRLGGLVALSKGSDAYDMYYPPFPDPDSQDISRAGKSSATKTNFTGDLHLNFEKNFGDHSLNVTGVYEYNKFVNEGFGVSARGPEIQGTLLTNNLGSATSITTSDINSFKNEVRIISFLGRLTYAYRDRYILAVNFRRDGSSKFGANNRWGNFPSAALAWRLTNERFMQANNWLDLKLRVSYGLTGNQENLPPYEYRTLYGSAGAYLFNGGIGQSYAATQEGNPDLKWEVRESFNVGMDFSLWRDRVNGMIDFFHDNTSDMLFKYNIPQPPFVTNQVYANAANAVNKGIEVSIGGEVVNRSSFHWTVRGNVGLVRNRITNLLGQFKGYNLTATNSNYGEASGGSFQSAYVTELKPGYPAGVFNLPMHAGFDSLGNELVIHRPEGKDTTSTLFTESDKIYIDPTPDFEWSIANTFIYKNFDLSIYVRGVQGGKVFANSLLNLESTAYLPAVNVSTEASNSGFAKKPNISTYWLQDASFARLENVTLGYTLKRLKGLRKLRVYVVGKNLLLLTDYRGLDPEVNVEGTQRYIDQSYYPKSKSITVGLDISF